MKLDTDIESLFSDYTPHVSIYKETTGYILKTVDDPGELSDVFRLRYDNFLSHTHHGKKMQGLDVDHFDAKCDHIIIIHKETKKTCGTYRVFSSLFNKEFYSQMEFDISRFLDIPGNKMELGRACVDRDFRNMTVIDLLWVGIAEYIQRIKARYLFGCSSIGTTDPELIKSLSFYFRRNNHVSDQYKVSTWPSYHLDLDDVNSFEDERDIKKQIPPLLGSYLSAGAKIHGTVAFDKDFECIDFFTILRLTDLSSLYKKRYFKKA